MIINIYTDGFIDVLNEDSVREDLPFNKVSDLINLFVLLNIGDFDENKKFIMNKNKFKIKNFKFNICNRKYINNSIVIEYKELENFVNEIINLKL
jgi:hypothetical protein